MKFRCGCGAQITDQTDHIPYKGYVLADEDFLAVYHAIGDAIEKSGPSPEEKKAAARQALGLLCQVTRTTIYQCQECGELRFDVDGDRHDHCIAVDPAAPKDLLGGRQDIRG